MEINKLTNDLRQKAEINPHQGLLFEAANKIEWLQSLVDDMTNDHFIDALDFYIDALDFYSEHAENLKKTLQNSL